MDRDKSLDDEVCPVCGYYCLGKGGFGCINKPKLTGLEAEPAHTPHQNNIGESYE